jgi:hypothetical protein
MRPLCNLSLWGDHRFAQQCRTLLKEMTAIVTSNDRVILSLLGGRRDQHCWQQLPADGQATA